MVDDKGREHEVLLRSFVHGQETMYLLDRLADLLHSVNAQAGDMLMLTRDETGPVVIPSSLACTIPKPLGCCHAAAHPAELCALHANWISSFSSARHFPCQFEDKLKKESHQDLPRHLGRSDIRV